MNRYYRVALFFLAFVLAFSLAGCGTAADSTQKASEKKIEKAEKKAKEEKTDPAETEVAQTEAVSAGTDSSNEQNVAGSGNTSDTSQSTTTNTPSQKTVTNNQAATNNAQTAPVPTPKATNPAPSAPAAVSNPEPAHTVTISIIGPKDRGTILGATKVDINTGDTVMDVLLKIEKSKKISVESRNDYGSTYVEAIDGIYEGDYPGQSGWTYKLNGVMVQESAGKAAVKDGDQIVWAYVQG